METTQAPPHVRISIQHLTKKYRSGRGVEDVSLAVEAGKVLALLGPNGAGKTTTVRCLVGLLVPQAGTVSIDGCHAAEDGAKRARAFVPDIPELYPALSVEEHLRFRGQSFGLREGLDERVAMALRETDLEELADTAAGELSRGQQQRVMIAAALVQHATTYILDEPTAGLDPPGLAWIERWVPSAAAAGAAVLVATHSLDFVARVAQRAVLMLSGRVAEAFDVPGDEHGVSLWKQAVLDRYKERLT